MGNPRATRRKRSGSRYTNASPVRPFDLEINSSRICTVSPVPSGVSKISWNGEFSYQNMHYHGRNSHYVGITLDRKVEFMVKPPGEDNFQFVEFPAGTDFDYCHYNPSDRWFQFFFEDLGDDVAFLVAKCPCCDSFGKVKRD